MKKKTGKLTLAVLLAAAYFLLLFLLVAAESGAEGATIRSLPTAVWYTLTTLTTVGYGDTYPVTAAGRVIGVLFQLLSMGLLALLISLAVTTLRTLLGPMIRLGLARRTEWFLFPEYSPASCALAGALRRQDPDSTVIFCGETIPEGARVPGIATSLSAPALLQMKKGAAPAHIFCMGSGSAENERRAASFDGENVRIYCMTEHAPDHLAENITLFNPYECCARLYWSRYPVLSAGERIVLIGEGPYAEELLEQALQYNVIDPAQHIRYDVIGDLENFRRNHPGLDEICSVNASSAERDSLVFANVPWNADLSLLQKADRIILCLPDEERTVSILTQLFRYCPVEGTVYARMSTPFEGAVVFGSPDEIFSPELVMKTALNATAIRLHEIYREQSGGKAPAWADLNSFTRRSNLASADHLSVKLRILLGNGAGADPAPDTGRRDGMLLAPDLCRRAYEAFAATAGKERDRLRAIEHLRWMRFHVLNGWQYAPARDNARRRHPLLQDYGKLPPEEQAKDDFSWELFRDLSRDVL